MIYCEFTYIWHHKYIKQLIFAAGCSSGIGQLLSGDFQNVIAFMVSSMECSLAPQSASFRTAPNYRGYLTENTIQDHVNLNTSSKLVKVIRVQNWLKKYSIN